MPEPSSLASPSVLVVILNWNSGEETVECLDTLTHGPYPRQRVLVVDNGSSDGSAAYIRARHPGVELLALDRNYGYAGGNNRGIAHALGTHDYVWLLNPDARVAPGCLATLISAGEAHPRAAMLGPLVRMREDPERILSAGGRLVDGWARHRGVGETDRGQFAGPAEVDYVTGCALLARRSAIASIGALDERFFVYHEEADWCYRARRAGFVCLLEPRAIAWHPDTRARDRDSPRVTYYIARNQLLFIRTHGLGAAVLARHLLQHARTLASWTLRRRWSHKAAQRRALRRALVDFARQRTGQAVGL